jgi:hypothetical protein
MDENGAIVELPKKRGRKAGKTVDGEGSPDNEPTEYILPPGKKGTRADLIKLK